MGIRRDGKTGRFAKARALHGCFLAPIRHENDYSIRIKKVAGAKGAFGYLAPSKYPRAAGRRDKIVGTILNAL